MSHRSAFGSADFPRRPKSQGSHVSSFGRRGRVTPRGEVPRQEQPLLARPQTQESRAPSSAPSCLQPNRLGQGTLTLPAHDHLAKAAARGIRSQPNSARSQPTPPLPSTAPNLTQTRAPSEGWFQPAVFDPEAPDQKWLTHFDGGDIRGDGQSGDFRRGVKNRRFRKPDPETSLQLEAKPLDDFDALAKRNIAKDNVAVFMQKAPDQSFPSPQLKHLAASAPRTSKDFQSTSRARDCWRDSTSNNELVEDVRFALSKDAIKEYAEAVFLGAGIKMRQ